MYQTFHTELPSNQELFKSCEKVSVMFAGIYKSAVKSCMKQGFDQNCTPTHALI